MFKIIVRGRRRSTSTDALSDGCTGRNGVLVRIRDGSRIVYMTPTTGKQFNKFYLGIWFSKALENEFDVEWCFRERLFNTQKFEYRLA